jgi:pyruvate dehydrogenase E2 component (dihydrolipoamide acetyltransferase)
MQVKVNMPRMGQSMEEGTIVRWLVKKGDRVKKDEILAELETDKAVVSLEAQGDGIIESILIPEGKLVPVGETLAIIEDGKAQKEFVQTVSAQPVQNDTFSANPIVELKNEPAEKIYMGLSGKRILASPAAWEFARKAGIDLGNVKEIDARGFITLANIKQFMDSNPAKETGTSNPAGMNVSPVAKRLAQELKVDLALVKGTGEGGRISREDVERFHGQSQIKTDVDLSQNIPIILPLSKIKQTIAQRMTYSKECIPHFYANLDVNMVNALAVREDLKIRGEEVSINDLVIYAVASTLMQYPNLNAVFQDNAIHQYPHVDMAIAVAVGNALITPVISCCEQLSLVEVALAAKAVIARTRAGTLMAEDLKMGTFTITNLGMFGIHEFAAIINPPQVAILAVGTVRRTPVFDSSGQVVPAELMNVTLSADHRAVDGAEVSQFLRDLKQNLEEGFQTGKLK